MNAEISNTAKLIGFMLSTYGDYSNGTNVRPGAERIAHMMNESSTKTVQRGMSELREHGWIIWDGVPTHPGQARVYRLAIPKTKKHRTPVSTDTPDTSVQNGGHLETKHRTPVSTHQGQTLDHKASVENNALAARVVLNANTQQAKDTNMPEAITNTRDLLNQLGATNHEIHEHQQIPFQHRGETSWALTAEYREWTLTITFHPEPNKPRNTLKEIIYIELESPHEHTNETNIWQAITASQTTPQNFRVANPHLELSIIGRGPFAISDIPNVLKVIDHYESNNQ